MSSLARPVPPVSARRPEGARRSAAPPPRRPAALAAPAGPLLLVAAIAGLTAAAAGDGTLPGDVAVARWLQAHPLPLAGPVTDLTNAHAQGVPLTIAALALAAVLLVAGRPGAALLIAVVTWVRPLNGPLKLMADSPRPAGDEVRVTELAVGLGFPSGHAMGATLVFLAIAVLLVGGDRPRPPHADGPRVPAPAPAVAARRLGVAACVAVVLLVGYGRVLSGAHWPSDVLGGWLYGLALLAVALRVARTLYGWVSRATAASTTRRRSSGDGGSPSGSTAWSRAETTA